MTTLITRLEVEEAIKATQLHRLFDNDAVVNYFPIAGGFQEIQTVKITDGKVVRMRFVNINHHPMESKAGEWHFTTLG